MFFKKKPQARNIKMPANLNRKQQREIKAVVERAKKDNGIPQTAQQSIPFQRMFPDGICRVTDSYYTKTIQFQDMPCMRSSKRTTPMPVPIPFPVGNRKGQSRKNMLPPKPVRIPLRQRLLHLRVQARQRAKQLREPRTSQKE